MGPSTTPSTNSGSDQRSSPSAGGSSQSIEETRLGHAIDNTSDVRNTVPTNSYDLKNERGNSTFDIRHIVTSFVSYQLPGSSKFAPRLTKGDR